MPTNEIAIAKNKEISAKKVEQAVKGTKIPENGIKGKQPGE